MNQSRWRKSSEDKLVLHNTKFAEHARDFNDNYCVRKAQCLPLDGGPPSKKLKSKAIATEAKLRLAFPQGPLDSLRSLARQYKITHATAQYVLKGMAQGLCCVSVAAIHHSMSLCSSAKSMVLCVVDRVKWDETRQRVSMRTSLDGKPLSIADLHNLRRPLCDRHAHRASGQDKNKGKSNGKGKCGGKSAKGRPGKSTTTKRSRRIRGGAENIMVQRRWVRFSKILSAESDLELSTKDLIVPVMCPPLLLKGQDAETILEGLKRQELIKWNNLKR
jgi:hypothetical protein